MFWLVLLFQLQEKKFMALIEVALVSYFVNQLIACVARICV